jgi:tetratricopeptide (TPR) repeat protein
MVKRLLIAAGLVTVGFLPIFPKKSGPTDYELELKRIDAKLAEKPLFAYQRAALTGDFNDFRAAERAIEQAFAAQGPTADLLLLRANFNFKLHRLDAAESDLRVLDAEIPGVAALRADLAFQRGRYDDARRGYTREVALAGKWDDYARLAWLQSRTGDVAGADRSYAQAEEQISVKEMRSYAWVELQRGLLSFERGRYEEALAHYRKAERAYSGYWLIEEHVAEVLDKLGKRSEAIALYEKIVAATHNPEYVNALARITGRGDLYAEADRLNAVRFALYPEAAIGHVIRDALARPTARPDLVQLAARNVALRPNAESKLLLARALLKVNDRAAAAKLVDEIVKTTPWRTAELEDLRRSLAPRSGERVARSAG